VISLSAPRAVLFDLDGTLADRAASLARYAAMLHSDFAHALEPLTVAETLEALRAADDFGSVKQAEALHCLLPWRTTVGSEALLAHWRERFGDACTPFDDVAPVIAALRERGVAMGLVTNGPSSLQRAKIKTLGIGDAMGVIAISGELGIEKPDRAIFDHALAAIGCGAAETWFVGDHPVLDVAGASEAGLTAFWVKTGVALGASLEPVRVLARLGALLSYLPR
jgi:putative hydrolase of the HAD superfamily